MARLSTYVARPLAVYGGLISLYCKNKMVVLTHLGLSQLQLQLSGRTSLPWNVCTFAVCNQSLPLLWLHIARLLPQAPFQWGEH